MNITKTLLEDILNESLAKDVRDLPNATKQHISGGGGTGTIVEGEDSHADTAKLGAGKTATAKRSEKQQERQTANAGSTEHIDKHDVEMHKHIAALLDAHHAMTSTSNKDDSHEHLSNLTRHLDKIKSAATNFHHNCNTGKDSDKDSDGFKGRLDAAHKSGMGTKMGLQRVEKIVKLARGLR